jgi:hypothetical protein
MSFLDNILRGNPYPKESKTEVTSLLKEMIQIGIKEDYLSETPGNGYNGQCRHIRTRQIGQRLEVIGGVELMQWAYERVRRKAGKGPASHLEYAWADIGKWDK